MEFDKRVLHVYKSPPLRGRNIQLTRIVLILYGHGILSYGHGKIRKSHGILSRKFFGTPEKLNKDIILYIHGTYVCQVPQKSPRPLAVVERLKTRLGGQEVIHHPVEQKEMVLLVATHHPI